MNNQNKTCGRCGGGGSITCPGCSGGGKKSINEGLEKSRIVVCSGCNGSGTVTCGRCGGSGQS